MSSPRSTPHAVTSSAGASGHSPVDGAVLALDLGGTNLRAGLLPRGAAATEIVGLAAEPAPRDLHGFTLALQRLLGEAARHDEVSAVGLAVPGTADGLRPRWVPKLPYLDDLDVSTIAEVPVTVANDAQLALLAEVSVGAATGRRDVVLFAIGTGIGSAVLAGGRIVTGHRGAACSAGWITLDPADPGDPSDGWLERHAAGPTFDAVAATFGRPGVDDASSLLSLAAAGDEAARDAIAGPARTLGAAIAASVALLDPELVLLAGGVAGSFAALAPHVRDVLDRHTPTHLRGVPIEVGRFGPRAGLLGAAIAGRRGSSWTEVEG